MGKEAKTSSELSEIPNGFINKDVIDIDFVDRKGFVTNIRKPMFREEWEKRREAVIKKGLP